MRNVPISNLLLFPSVSCHSFFGVPSALSRHDALTMPGKNSIRNNPIGNHVVFHPHHLIVFRLPIRTVFIRIPSVPPCQWATILWPNMATLRH